MSTRTQQRPSATFSTRVTINAVRGPNALVDLKPIWNELLTESDANTIFLTWEWAASWWHAFGAPFELVILQCLDSTGRPVGIVPLFRVRESIGLRVSGYALYLLGDVSGGSEKLDWIVRDAWEKPVVTSVLDWLESPALEWDIFYYDTVRPESIVATILAEECGRRHWFLSRGERPSYRVPVSASWEVYLASISKKMRSGIQQQVRRASKNFTVQARLCQTPEQLETDLQTLFALHAKRWRQRGKTGNLFQNEKQSFYHELAKKCLANGWLEFWMLEFNGNPVACEFGFCYDGIYSFLQGGFDPEYSVYSVGVVLRASIMQSLIERGFRLYDFLLGEDDYKERWGGQRYPLSDFSLARPQSRGHRIMVARNRIIRAIDWLRTRTPKPVWVVARRAFQSVIGKK